MPDLPLSNSRDLILDLLPPPLEWIPIPAGQVTLEENAGTLDVQPFFMAKYPTTFEQFQVFVDDPQGFNNPAWWLGLAAGAEHRAAPGEQWFVHAQNLPRETVSWYDAVAFCRWLNGKVGYGVRLPTEWEWQWAAQGPDGRAYPWGPTYIQGYANVNETAHDIEGGVYLNKTTAVGSYPHGASPYGVLDMSGNVFEWCLNEYATPANTGVGSNERRALRGGSWINSQYSSRAAHRSRGYPDDRYYYFGFRLACSYLSR